MSCESVDWSDVAEGWGRHRRAVEAMKSKVTASLLARLEARPGERLLELGSATGELAAQLAAIVGSQGSLIASDVADGMVGLLKERLADLPNTTVTQIDACDIPLTDGSVDAVVFRMGLMLIEDPDVALREIRRVLKPGGRFVGAVWASPQENPWLTSVGMSAMMHGLVSGGPPIGPGGPFSLADAHALTVRMTASGLDKVTVDEVKVTAIHVDADSLFSHVIALAPPLATALSAASPEAKAAVRTTVGELTSQFRRGDHLEIPGRALLFSARRP